MKQRVAEMEMEANKLRELQAAAEQSQTPDAGSAMETDEDKAGADGRSVYVGNVRPLLYAFRECSRMFAPRLTMELLLKRFKHISKLVARLTGLLFSATSLLATRKGTDALNMPTTVMLTNFLCTRYAYVEFSEPEHIDAAVALDNSLFRGRLIKVVH